MHENSTYKYLHGLAGFTLTVCFTYAIPRVQYKKTLFKGIKFIG